MRFTALRIGFLLWSKPHFINFKFITRLILWDLHDLELVFFCSVNLKSITVVTVWYVTINGSRIGLYKIFFNLSFEDLVRLCSFNRVRETIPYWKKFSPWKLRKCFGLGDAYDIIVMAISDYNLVCFSLQFKHIIE